MSTRSTTRVTRLDEREMLRDERFQQELQVLAARLQISEENARRQAEDKLAELAVRPDDRYLDWIGYSFNIDWSGLQWYLDSD